MSASARGENRGDRCVISIEESEGLRDLRANGRRRDVLCTSALRECVARFVIGFFDVGGRVRHIPQQVRDGTTSGNDLSLRSMDLSMIWVSSSRDAVRVLSFR